MVGWGRAGDPGKAYEDGGRVVWHHGWFHRNGKYFNPDWPFDSSYPTVWGERKFSYAELKSNIEAFQNAGLECLVYFQFAGVSEDVTDEFEPSIIRDPAGEQIVSGRDGDYANIWANPDPQGTYGASVLRQVDQLLSATGADRIALDRSDRLDFTYGWDLYDYGGFNGYASAFKHDGRRRPVSSITTAGREWFTSFRRILDKHDAKVISNVPVTPRVFRLSDGALVDQALTPNTLLYLKALANGKSLFVIDTHRPSTPGDEPMQARLIQAQPFIIGGATWPVNRQRGRLLYAVSENGHYPTLWFFDNGHTRMTFDPTGETVPEKYAGSTFVLRGK